MCLSLINACRSRCSDPTVTFSMFLRSSSSSEGGSDAGCVRGSLCFCSDKTLNFAGMSHTLAVLTICNFTKFATDWVEREKFSARLVNASVSEVVFVQRWTLSSKNSTNVSFSAVSVSSAHCIARRHFSTLSLTRLWWLCEGPRGCPRRFVASGPESVLSIRVLLLARPCNKAAPWSGIGFGLQIGCSGCRLCMWCGTLNQTFAIEQH